MSLTDFFLSILLLLLLLLLLLRPLRYHQLLLLLDSCFIFISISFFLCFFFLCGFFQLDSTSLSRIPAPTHSVINPLTEEKKGKDIDRCFPECHLAAASWTKICRYLVVGNEPHWFLVFFMKALILPFLQFFSISWFSWFFFFFFFFFTFRLSSGNGTSTRWRSSSRRRCVNWTERRSTSMCVSWRHFKALPRCVCVSVRLAAWCNELDS